MPAGGSAAVPLEHGMLSHAVMDEATYREAFTQFLNEYWGAFHEVLEAQSVNAWVLADPLFDALVNAHQRFESAHGEVDPAVSRLDRLWRRVASRRKARSEVPLSPDEVAEARTEFETIYNRLAVIGEGFPGAATEAISHAVHGTPLTALRPDAAW